MPWKASSVMEERLRFVARLLDGETMTDVCREFAISRKTGYKIFDRYKEHGLEALTDRQIRDLFEVARVSLRPRSPMDVRTGLATVEEWVAAFKSKRSEIASRRCA